MSIFDAWNKEKQMIDRQDLSHVYINHREIWFVKMGKNIGFEQDGKTSFLRPVLVIKKVGNLFFTVPLTSRGKSNLSFYHKLTSLYLQNPKYKDSSYLVLSQARVLDRKRFKEKVGFIREEEYEVIKQKLRTLLC